MDYIVDAFEKVINNLAEAERLIKEAHETEREAIEMIAENKGIKFGKTIVSTKDGIKGVLKLVKHATFVSNHTIYFYPLKKNGKVSLNKATLGNLYFSFTDIKSYEIHLKPTNYDIYVDSNTGIEYKREQVLRIFFEDIIDCYAHEIVGELEDVGDSGDE